MPRREGGVRCSSMRTTSRRRVESTRTCASSAGERPASPWRGSSPASRLAWSCSRAEVSSSTPQPNCCTTVSRSACPTSRSSSRGSAIWEGRRTTGGLLPSLRRGGLRGASGRSLHGMADHPSRAGSLLRARVGHLQPARQLRRVHRFGERSPTSTVPAAVRQGDLRGGADRPSPGSQLWSGLPGRDDAEPERERLPQGERDGHLD